MVKVKATLIKTNKVFSSKRGYKSAIVTMKVAGSSIICCFSDVGFFLIGILFCYTIIVQNSATTCWLVGSLARWLVGTNSTVQRSRHPQLHQHGTPSRGSRTENTHKG